MRGWLARRGIGITTALVAMSLLVSAVSLGLTVGLYAKFSNEAHSRVTGIRTGQVQNCHVIGEPVRLALIQLLRDQIAQSRSAELTKFFPQIPPDQLKMLIGQANARRQRVIDSLSHVPPCERRYPPAPH